jgi:ATP-dependent helicase HrpB
MSGFPDVFTLAGAAGLPVLEALAPLCAALAEQPNAVLVAPPGAGKTTTVPLALKRAPWCDGKILMLEPRRLAARAAASRMAQLIGQAVGQHIGFTTRLERAVSAATVIEVITEGLLIRRLEHDPGLEGVSCVIFDEIHERSLDSDLALALCLDLQTGLRPELRLVAMSATLDGARLSALLDAPVIESAGLLHPVTITQAAKDIAQIRDLPEACARAIRVALGDHPGDILAFLPGMGEIRRTEAALQNCGALVLALHGDLAPAEQDRALSPAPGQRRVVLASSIAETSLTVPGVRIVIDGGFRRAPVLDVATGLSRLATLRISRAAADQRAGRAGREAPGVAIRLWSATQHRGLAAFERPEILESELSALVLTCAAWGADPSALRFPDTPPAGRIEAGRALLRELGALDADNRITALGKAMARLGAHPRLAAMMLSARNAGEAALAADLAALLEERDPLRDCGTADIGVRLAALDGRDGRADRGVIFRVKKAAEQFRARLKTRAPASGDAGYVLAAGFPDRVALSRGEGAYRLSGGGTARLAANDPLARQNALIAPDLEQKDSARIKLAAVLDLTDLPPVLAARVTETRESGFDAVSGAVFSRRRKRLGALILADRMVAAEPGEAAATLARILCEKPDLLPWDNGARQFQGRIAHGRAAGFDLPDLADAALAADGGAWLAPYLENFSKLGDCARADLTAALRARLDYTQISLLDRELPAAIELPGGRARIDYTLPVPQAEARAQVFYGQRTTPQLAQGRVPLRLALLSPPGRPIAVTADLAAFWAGGWAEARRDMRGRYPRQSWPEDPGAAVHVKK